jgi:hypothetical protein
MATTAGAAADAQPFHGAPHGGPAPHAAPAFQGAQFRGGPSFRGGPGPVVRGDPVFRGPTGFGGPRFGGPGFVSAGYQRWGYGDYLPRGWLSPARYIVDFGYYGLAAPAPDFEWVQDGPDALLVNLDTGMVVQVVPGAFA